AAGGFQGYECRPGVFFYVGDALRVALQQGVGAGRHAVQKYGVEGVQASFHELQVVTVLLPFREIGRASCRRREAVAGGDETSRRRHTRFSRDWSSDVCSSDLPPGDSRGMNAGRGSSFMWAML